MRINLRCVSFLVATLLPAQTATAPVAAIVLNGQGRLVSITGVLQSLLPGAAFGSYGHVESASFGTSGGVVKTDSQLLVVNAAGQVQSQSAAPPGPAFFGLGTAGDVAWVYFPANSQIESLDGTVAFSTKSLGDEVVAMGAENAAGITLLARTGTQLWAETVAVHNGAVLTQTPVTGTAPGIYFEGGWLVTGERELVWGAQIFPTAAPVVTLQTAGPHSVAVNSQWLINSAWKILEIPAINRLDERRNTASPVGARY